MNYELLALESTTISFASQLGMGRGKNFEVALREVRWGMQCEEMHCGMQRKVHCERQLTRNSLRNAAHSALRNAVLNTVGNA